MSAGSFDVHVLDGFGSEPGAEIAIVFDQVVVVAAGNPEQVQLLIAFGVKRGKFLVEFRREAAGAEGADPGKFIEVTLRDVGIVENAGMGLENFWFAIAEWHDDEHRLGFALCDEVVEDDVGAANGGPSAGVVAIAVQEIQDGITLFGARVIAGWGVNEKVTMVADYRGLIKMVMNFAVRNAGDFPGKRWPGDVHFAGAIKEIWLGAVVGGVEEADAVGNEGVTVIIGSEWIGGDAPYALIIFLHGHGLGRAFDLNRNFFRVGIAEAKGDGVVGPNVGRNEWRRLGLR